MKNHLLSLFLGIGLILFGCNLIKPPITNKRVVTSDNGGKLTFNLNKKDKITDLSLSIPINNITYHFIEQNKVNESTSQLSSGERAMKSPCPDPNNRNCEIIILGIKRQSGTCHCPPGTELSVKYNPTSNSFSVLSNNRDIVAEYKVPNTNLNISREQFSFNFK